MSKRRTVRAQRAYDEGHEHGYLEGRHEVLTQVVDGGLRLLTSLLQIGLAVETARAAPAKSPWAFAPDPAKSPLRAEAHPETVPPWTSPECRQRPMGVAKGCTMPAKHPGPHCNGTDSWDDCGAKNPAYVGERNNAMNCNHARGHIGSHSNGFHEWPA